MRIALAMFVALSCTFAVSARAADAPAADRPAKAEVVKLHRALADGRVEASGSHADGYTSVRLHLKNLTPQALAVDIAGSHLDPTERGSCQRLGLGPPLTPSSGVKSADGKVLVVLAPGAAQDVDVNTCCLDLGLPAPSAESFVGSKEALPKVREDVLRWWVDHPGVQQSFVNEAIWQNSPKVQLSGAGPRGPASRCATVRGDDYYQLVDGELTRTGADGVRRLLGTGIQQVIPTDDAVYSVMPGDDGLPKLWRLQMTGERCWSRVMDLESGDLIRDVFVGGKGRIVLVTDKSVDVHDVRTDVTTRVIRNDEAGRVSVRREPDGNLIVTTRRPATEPKYVKGERQSGTQAVFELWSLSPATAKAERVRDFWSIGAMTAGPAGVFALSPTEGALKRFSGERFASFGPGGSYGRVFVVATDVVWLSDLEGKLVAVNASTGAVRLHTDVSIAETETAGVDPKTGDIAYVRGESFFRLRAADGRVETVPGAPQRQ